MTAKKKREPLTARQKAFLVAYAACGTITHAATAAKIARKTHYQWLKKKTDYANAFDEAKSEATDNLIQEARRRAAEGVDEPVFSGRGTKSDSLGNAAFAWGKAR